MPQPTDGARVLVIRLVWIWVLLGLLLLIGSGLMLFIRHREHNRRAADQLEQVKMQLLMHMEEKSVENTEENIFSIMKKEKHDEDTEQYISTIDDIENNNDTPYSVNDNDGQEIESTGMSSFLNERVENSNYSDSNIKAEEHIEYIYDADYEEEIQEEIKSVEKQEIKKDITYAKRKITKNNKHKLNKQNKENINLSIYNKNNEDLTYDDYSKKCNYPPCPVHPPGLLGILEVPKVSNEVSNSVSKDVTTGGSWWPRECQARYRVAVLIPYNNNQQKLILHFLQHMHGILQRQQLNYTLFFIQQKDDEALNHGKLHNVGYLLTKSTGPWDCWIFHDMNLLPLDDRHLYHCEPFPKHLSVRTLDIPLFPVNELEFYKAGFAGVTMLSQEHMEATNGWSNKFWDAENEMGKNMKWRLSWQDLVIWRYPPAFATYINVGNKIKRNWGKDIMDDMWATYMGVKTSNFKNDGLSSTEYKVINITQEPLYTNILVDIGKHPVKH
ncbi:unnamed protein product [Meganyctiphanes norvegica]|uniref:Beta-1,4-N-acetylgalactosaminyltransferase n=1 Tax=Meganyctiphanes norvegica TaxID=48144 RepID=A0AAV2QAE6_MEGNR